MNSACPNTTKSARRLPNSVLSLICIYQAQYMELPRIAAESIINSDFYVDVEEEGDWRDLPR